MIHLELSYAAPDGAVGRWPQLDLTPGLNRDSTGADLASSQLLSIGNGKENHDDDDDDDDDDVAAAAAAAADDDDDDSASYAAGP